MKILEIKPYPEVSEDFIDITWEVTKNCSFACGYCRIVGKEEFPEVDNTIEFLNRASKLKEVSLMLFGGEPTLHPNFLDILGRLDPAIDLSVFTNLSRGLPYLTKMIDSRKDLHVYTSYHPYITNFDKFVSCLEYLRENKTLTTIFYMADTNIEGYEENFFKLKDLGFKVFVSKIEDYPQKESSFVQEHFGKDEGTSGDEPSLVKLEVTFSEEDIVKTDIVSAISLRKIHKNNFRGFMCDAGKKALYIMSDGSVHPCVEYKNQSIRKPMFNIIEEFDKAMLYEFNTPTFCLAKSCMCNVDISKKRAIG